MKQKIFIKTFGCQMNEYDSNRIYDSVKKIGYEKTENYEDANCYLLNTCHIRDKAKEKVYHEIGRVKKIFRSKHKPLVIIAGCVAQAENQEMLKREPYIDLVIGPQSYHKINDTILNHIEKKKKIEETEFDAISKFEYLKYGHCSLGTRKHLPLDITNAEGDDAVSGDIEITNDINSLGHKDYWNSHFLIVVTEYLVTPTSLAICESFNILCCLISHKAESGLSCLFDNGMYFLVFFSVLEISMSVLLI